MNRRNLASIVELIGLFILLLAVIVIITQVFVMSRSHSLQAKELTQAVIAAENAAEAASVSPDAGTVTDELAGLDDVIRADLDADLNGNDVVWAVIDAGDGRQFVVSIERSYPLYQGSAGNASDISDDGSGSDSGIYAEDVISVYEALPVQAGDDLSDGSRDTGELIYTLKTGNYFREGA